jgi:GT2 family glycosyltransferase
VPTARVTAIVVVHGATTDQLTPCFASLAASASVEIDLVVVDNASPDGGQAIAEALSSVGDTLHASVLHLERNRGFAAGVNAGLRAATADLVWLINDDAVVAPDSIARCVDALERAPAGTVAIAPVVHLAGRASPSGHPVIDAAGLVLRRNGEAFSAGLGQPDLGQYRSGEECLGPCFVAGLFRRSAFDESVVGPLDERFFLYYEDVDWAARAKRKGWRVERLADSGVTHEHARSSRTVGEGRRYRMVQRNLLVFAVLDLSPRRASSIWLQRLVVHAKGLVTGPYRRDRVLAVLGAAARLPAAIAGHRRRARSFRLPDDVLFEYAAGEVPYLQAGTFEVDDPVAAERAARERLTPSSGP